MDRTALNQCANVAARSGRRGITLIESVLAAAILAMAVLAVFSAIGAGTAHAQESGQRIAATMASEDLLARVLLDEGAALERWDGYQEPVGGLVDETNRLLALPQQTVGRRVMVRRDVRSLPGLDPVNGHLVTVEAFDGEDRVLSSSCEWAAENGGAP